MIEIDGSQGEGGGQIVRTSLTLSAITGQACRLSNIRAGRKRTGLLRQHLTAVKALEEICQAETSGVELGSLTVEFAPSRPCAGDYRFDIGSAGSATLVAQTVLPVLLHCDQPSTLTVSGGTHNAWAPTYDYLERVFVPQLAKLGPAVSLALDRYGFYPAGGGLFSIQIQPATAWNGFELMEREGELVPSVVAIVSGIAANVAERECKLIRSKTGWAADRFEVKQIEPPHGPGNAVIVELASDNVTEMFTGFGKAGVRAEQVARDALKEARRYISSEAPVGPHLADQLILPLALAATHNRSRCQFRTYAFSSHSRTQQSVVPKFMDVEIRSITDDHGTTVVLDA